MALPSREFTRFTWWI